MVTGGMQMKTTFTTQGTCARFIDLEIDDGQVRSVRFIGGCTGNAQGVAALVAGMPAEEAIRRLRGIRCRGNTSCPDQLAQALETLLLQQAS